MLLILLGLVPARHRRAFALLLMAATCALCLERLATLHGAAAVRAQAPAWRAEGPPAPQSIGLAAAFSMGLRFEPPHGLDENADWGVPTYGASVLAATDLGAIAP